MGRRSKHSSSSSSSFWYSLSRSSSAPATPPEPPMGCMSMVHYLIFAPGAGCVGRPPAATASCNNANAIVVTNQSSGGFEAPRNSLDLEADNHPNDIDIQIGVQIEPVFDALAIGSSSKPPSEAETPRTPSLVARLMGIDGLPDSPAPQHMYKKPGGSTGPRTAASSAAAAGEEKIKKKRVIPESMNRRRDREPLRSLSCNVVAVAVEEPARSSLPDTPARASWDGVPLPRRPSSALRDNVLHRAAQYVSMPSSPTSLSGGNKEEEKKKKKKRRRSKDGRDEQSAAKEEHAREILRLAKETVASRKSGSGSASASGKSKNGSGSSSPAPEKKSSFFNNNNNNKENVMMEDNSNLPTVTSKQSSEHHSPRVPLAPRRQQQQASPSPPPPPPHRAKPSRPPPPPPPLDPPPTRARKPDGCERFATRAKKPACPASAPTTWSSSSPPSTKTTTTTTDCCCSAVAAASSSSKPPPPLPLKEEDDDEEHEHPEYRYLRTVLERGGFMRSSLPRRPWRGQYSSASPVDPIVFHLLELELEMDESESRRRLGPLRHRWNRKLLFHLAQELLLAEDHLDASSSSPSTGLPLLGKVWRKARSFPAADCRVVGDIDALVAADLEDQRRRHPAVVEQEEARDDVAAEVADRVLDALLAESVSLSS